MYIIPHTQEMINASFRKAKELGVLNNSITRGQGNVAGYLGEETVASYLGADIMSNDEGTQKFNHDLILLDGRRAEVKTKRRTVPPCEVNENPKRIHDASIANTSLHQKPDLYIFVSLQFKTSIKTKTGRRYKSLEHIWIVGQKTPEAYFKSATFWLKGTVDPTNGFKTHADMWNLPINKLEELIK
tara:strand:- start:43 stop:600 length:558 start_codon:yes stop_codon:yes gene_type:complete